MDSVELDDAWLERLAQKLAAAFRPYFGNPKQEDWDRAVADFLQLETLPAPEVLRFGRLDCEGAIYALTRWLGLDGSAAPEGLSVAVRGTLTSRGQPRAAAFRRVEIAPEVRHPCISSGTLLLERGGHRWAVVVEFDDYPPFDVEFSLYCRRDDAEAFAAEVESAVDRHRLGRGSLLVYRTTGPCLLRRPQLVWDDVILEAGLCDEIRRNVEVPLAASAGDNSAALPCRRSLLLSGQPGTGKTLIGKALAATLPHVSFLWVTPGGLGQCADFQALFDWARQRTPAILFFEDLDLAVGGRKSGESGMLGELLAQLDGFADNDGIVAIATTNEPKVIDEALRRPGRFDRHFIIDLPADAERRVMLERFLADTPVESRASLLADVVRATASLTGAHLKELVQSARLACAARGGTLIDQTDFAAAFAPLRGARRIIGFALPQEDATAPDERAA